MLDVFWARAPVVWCWVANCGQFSPVVTFHISSSSSSWWSYVFLLQVGVCFLLQLPLGSWILGPGFCVYSVSVFSMLFPLHVSARRAPAGLSSSSPVLSLAVSSEPVKAYFISATYV